MANTWSKEDTKTARSILLEHLKQKGDGWFAFNASHYASDFGADPSTIQKYLRALQDDHIIELKSNTGRGGGYKIRMSNGEPAEEPKLRTCRRCGTMAANENARFCWKCGETLLTEKELLKEEFNMTLGRICRFINDSRELQRITDTLDKVGKLAFKEE